jgi:PST family polysaccharide transporter
VAAALLVASAPLVAAWLRAPELTVYLLLFALGRPVSGLSGVHSSTLVGRGRFGPWALLTVVYWAARLALAVVLVSLGLSVEGAILATLGASLVHVLVARLFVQPSWGKRAAFPLSRVASYALPLMVHGLGMRLFGYLDIPVLQSLGGDPALAGYYSAAQNLSIVPLEMLGQAFSPPLFATLARLVGQGQSGQARDVVSGAMRWLSWVLPLGGVVMGMAHEVVQWVYGASYLPAARLLGFLFLAGWSSMIIWLSCAMLAAAGKPGWTPVLTTPLPLVVLAGHWFLIPRLGATGAALSTLATACLGALATLWVMYRTWSVLPPIKSLLRGAIAGALACAGGSAFPAAGWAVPLKLAILAGAVIVGLASMGEFRNQDVVLLRSLLPIGGGRALGKKA